MEFKGKKLFLYFTAVLIVLFTAVIISNAAPYDGISKKLAQPDDSLVKVKIYGDEFYQRVESVDGYTLVRDPETGWICYAKLNKKGTDFVSTGKVYNGKAIGKSIAAGDEQLEKGLELKKDAILKKVKKEKSKADFDEFLKTSYNMDETKDLTSTEPAQDKGLAAGNTTVVGLTILIKFPDQSATFTKAQMSDLFNLPGYTGSSNKGSIRDYFYDVSGGKLQYTNNITEYYTTSRNKSYYDDPNVDCGTKGRELLTEALNSLKNNSAYFAGLTTTSNKIVLAVNVMYAGNCSSGWSKGLWPHSYNLATPYKINDNVYIQRYQMTDIGSDLKIGTICHENGHMVCGWPDTYDYGYQSKGAGYYDLMAYGNNSKNPVPPNPYFRNVLSGWGPLTDVRYYGKGDVTVAPNTVGSLIAYRPYNSDEFFMVENIKNTAGTRYANLPGSGLLIWHIDRKGSNDNEQMTAASHYMVAVEQADGLFNLEKNNNAGHAADFFNQGYKTEFNASTVPSSRWWDNWESNFNVSNVRNSGSNIIFTNRFALNRGPKYNSQLKMPYNIALGDINRDGLGDFVQFSGKNIYVYGADFKKTPIIQSTMGSNIKQIILGDFVNGGSDQVVTITEDGYISLYGTSPDAKQLWWSFSQGNFVQADDDVIVGDFNGDKKDEIMTYKRSTGAIVFYSLKANNVFFEVMPNYELGNIPNNMSNNRVRALDTDANGRDDLAFINPAGQVLIYGSVFANSKNTFWWAFTTAGNTIKANEEVSVARVDDNLTDDLAVHNDATGALAFYRPEYLNGLLRPLSVDKGQIGVIANSKLFFGNFRGILDEPGNKTRHDALVYDIGKSQFVRSDARWSGSIITYWWAYTNNITIY